MKCISIQEGAAEELWNYHVTGHSAVSLSHHMCCVLLADPGCWGSQSNIMVVLKAHFSHRLFAPGMGKSPMARCWEWGFSGLRSTSGCVMQQAKQGKKRYLPHETGARWRCHGSMSQIYDLCATLCWDLMGQLHSCHEIRVEDRALWMSLTSSSFLSLLFKPSHSKQKIHSLPLAPLCTDHTLGLVAVAQKDYSQSPELPKRLSTAERQEWFPGSWEDASARTAVSSAEGYVCQHSSVLSCRTCFVIAIQS